MRHKNYKRSLGYLGGGIFTSMGPWGWLDAIWRVPHMFQMGWNSGSTISTVAVTMDRIGPLKIARLLSNPWWYRVLTSNFLGLFQGIMANPETQPPTRSVAYNPPEGKEYKWYTSGIYCQLGDYILPTTL